MSSGVRVYSYSRFSDPKQAAGSSVERQTAYAESWARERGLALDDSLTLHDAGLSAYHQRHVTQGALGAFLRAVDDGKIAPGSYLVVEGLDRLSRAEPILAQAQLAQIVNAGITVVTASDNKEYNRERLKNTPMDLVYSLLVMIRAHEESDTKAKRVKAAIRRQCEGWIAGTYRGAIRNGHDPIWVRWNGEAFELEPVAAESMRRVITLFRAGEGAQRIIRTVGAPMNSISLYKAIKRDNLIGVKTLELDGEVYRLEGYYPPLLTLEEYADLQAHVATRTRRRGKGEIPGVITGIGILYCGYCGSALCAQNLMSRKRKENGNPQDGHRRLACCGIKSPQGCAVPDSTCSVVPVERAVLEYCSDQMNLNRLLHGDSRESKLLADAARQGAEISELERQLERVTTALVESDAAPLAFVKKARELEGIISDRRKELESTRAQAMKAGIHAPAQASAWLDIADRALALDYDARMVARQLVADTFERIVLYRDGLFEEERGKGRMVLWLFSKSGGRRQLVIERRTGRWVEAIDF